MRDEGLRDRNILDDGIKCREVVTVLDLCGEIVAADFVGQTVTIEISVPAHMVRRVTEPCEGTKRQPDEI